MQPSRLVLDRTALVANYRWHEARAGVPLAAAVKADGYGLGARPVVAALHAAGCRAFLVSTFAEADALGHPGEGASVLVLHGFTGEEEAPLAQRLPWVRPVLSTARQVARWAAAFPGRPADLMVDTGMNRLGLAPAEVAPACAAVAVAVVHSHLATADEPGHPLTERQLERFREVVAATPGAAHALANSAAIAAGPRFSFDLARPGLGLYGGRPHPASDSRPVLRLEARVLQLRTVPKGAPVGYGATWTAPRPSRIATINLGYADGVPRALAPHLSFGAGDRRCPVVGRISMDLMAVDVTEAEVSEGDWLVLEPDLARLSARSGLSQYELLTGLARRLPRTWR
ncbi:MAG: alanine racemase [Sphingomonadaceae bacterium]|uniref:alanine racemase n=1 Tax=Thermaurantiacus sp. TaxID=2820283 RepID=UPI00298EE68B|nr:alanine racemase [Thermaurantiacus sp.]MCS6987067.1 alanine racemase [Sphingomonadaceae bacterium]MDW8415595.1 alanine racemase [Thermaurantiacus sp.]